MPIAAPATIRKRKGNVIRAGSLEVQRCAGENREDPDTPLFALTVLSCVQHSTYRSVKRVPDTEAAGFDVQSGDIDSRLLSVLPGRGSLGARGTPDRATSPTVCLSNPSGGRARRIHRAQGLLRHRQPSTPQRPREARNQMQKITQGYFESAFFEKALQSPRVSQRPFGSSHAACCCSATFAWSIASASAVGTLPIDDSNRRWLNQPTIVARLRRPRMPRGPSLGQ